MGSVARRSAVLAGLCAVAVIAGTASVLTGPATPAAASVPGIATYIHLSTKNSDDKTVTINCPKGKKVIDAGGEIESGYGKVIMDDVFPDPDLNFVSVTGLETDSYGTSWSAEAVVTCADPLPGLEWIKAQTATNSVSPKSLTVACSAGKTVLGNGYAITGGAGEAWVDEAVPNGGRGVAATKVDLIGVEGDAYSGDWRLDGFLICADPLPGQQVVSVSSTPTTTDTRTEATCEGLQIPTGSTAELHYGTGTVVLAADSLLEDTYLDERIAWAYGEENDEADSDWWITSYAFCVDR
jgi:hypothetical protein